MASDNSISNPQNRNVPIHSEVIVPIEELVHTSILIWTAEMFLIFRLGRLDVLPVTDLGIRKAMQKTYSLSELPKPAEMLAIAQPWKPYRTVATWYLWKSLSKFHSIG